MRERSRDRFIVERASALRLECPNENTAKKYSRDKNYHALRKCAIFPLNYWHPLHDEQTLACSPLKILLVPRAHRWMHAPRVASSDHYTHASDTFNDNASYCSRDTCLLLLLPCNPIRDFIAEPGIKNAGRLGNAAGVLSTIITRSVYGINTVRLHARACNQRLQGVASRRSPRSRLHLQKTWPLFLFTRDVGAIAGRMPSGSSSMKQSATINRVNGNQLPDKVVSVAISSYKWSPIVNHALGCVANELLWCLTIRAKSRVTLDLSRRTRQSTCRDARSAKCKVCKRLPGESRA